MRVRKIFNFTENWPPIHLAPIGVISKEKCRRRHSYGRYLSKYRHHRSERIVARYLTTRATGVGRTIMFPITENAHSKMRGLATSLVELQLRRS